MITKYNTLILSVLSLLVVALGVSTLTLFLKQRGSSVEPPIEEVQSVVSEATRAANLDVKKTEALVPLTVTSLSQDVGVNGLCLIANFYPSRGLIRIPTNCAPVRITPEVANLSCRVIGQSLIVIDGDFKDDTSYKVTFAKGWTTSEGLSLPADIERSIKTRKPTPFLRAVNNGLFYPASREGIKFPISSLGIEKYKVSIYHAYDSNLPIYGYSDCSWSTKWSDIFIKSHLLKEGFATVSGPNNCQLNSILDLSLFMTNYIPGFYRVVIEDVNERDSDDFAFALTDLAPQVFIEPNVNSRAVVCVTSLGNGRAVAGAKVIAYTRNHQVAGTAATDSRGIAIVKLDPRFDYKGNEGIVGVEVRTTNDFTYVDFELTGSMAASGAGDAYNGPFALVFSERELCRPGESFESSVLVRTAAKDGARAMAETPVELALYDAGNNLIESRRLITDKYGLVSTSWEIPADAEVGEWSVDCRIASKRLYSMPIYVAAYVPDRFAVSLESSVDDVIGFDSTVEFIGSADYYFGEPVSSGNCQMTFLANKAKKPRHWRGWSVGVDAPFKQKKLKVEPEFRNGKFSYAYEGLDENSFEGATYPISLLAVADVQEAGGRTVSSSDTVTYFGSDWYIGIREAKAPAADSQSFDIAMLPAIQGTTNLTLPFKELKASLARKEWNRHLEVSGSSIKVVWREDIVQLEKLSKTLSLSINNPASYTGRIDYASSELQSGQYVLTVRGDDSIVSSIEFWHWAGEGSERTQNIADLILTPLAPSFKPGEEAEISFYAPRAGSLYVVAGVNGIDQAFALNASAGKNTIKVPVPKDIIAGSYYVSVTLIADGANGSMRRVAGYTKVKIDSAQLRRLDLSLDYPEKVIPGDSARITVSLKNSKGEPVAGVVKIGAIDEGVAAMSDFHVANPFSYFYGRDFGLPFACFDIFNLLYPELKLLPNGAFGGDMAKKPLRGMAGANRSDSTVKQKETARFALSALYVPTNGVAAVDVKFPMHVGALRLTAVAANETSVGSAEDTIILRNLISVLPTMPRFAVGGDCFRFTSTLFNHEEEKGEWILTVKLPKGMLSDGKNEIVHKGILDKGASCVESFNVDISDDAAGVKEVIVKLTLGDSVVEEKTFITIRPRLAAVTSVEYLSVTNGAITLPPVAEAWHSNAKSTVELSAMPILAIAESLQWLSDYPYACLEQTTSAAFPFLVSSDLLKLGVIDESLVAQANLKVKTAYALIMQMHCGYGAFSMWPGGSSPWVYGTIYANHFIFEAANMGLIKVDNKFRMLEREWLRGIAANAAPENRMDRAYAVYALALNGDKGFIIHALNVISQCDNDFAALVASAAMMRFGYAAEGVAVFEKAVAARAWETASEWNRIKNLGMTLFMASKAGYRDHAKLMPIIAILNNELRDDGSAWGTTRDNAWSVLGLASFAQLIGAKDATGVIKMGVVESKFDVTSKPFLLTRENDSEVKVLSEDTLFAKVVTVGTPKKPLPRKNAISISRAYLDEDGKPVTRVRSGSLVTAVIKIKSPVDIDRAVLVDLVPGGFELEDVTLATRSNIAGIIPPSVMSENPQPQPIGNSEIRDDRWLWFGYLPKAQGDKECTLTYNLRAVIPGTYSIPQVVIEDMYEPDMRGDDAPEGSITIE